MISKQEWDSIRPGDKIELYDTLFTIDEVDVLFGSIIITKMYCLQNGKPQYTRDTPYRRNSSIRLGISKLIKGKITCWRKRIENGK